MATLLRKLNQQGIDRFQDYVLFGGQGEPPIELLDDPTTSQPITGDKIELGSGHFDNRFDFGSYLNSLLRNHDPATFSRDQGFWTAMALVWFDRLCPSVNGKRKPDQSYRYVLSGDYRHYYRHLVRTPWQLYRDHGENARFLLTSDSAKARKAPLAVHGEILEQFGGRQQVLSSKVIIKHANKMYLDPETKFPKRGVAGNGQGSARRFGFVLRQFDLTYDPASMTDEEFLTMLPSEFDRWKAVA